MLAKLLSLGHSGIEGYRIEVETFITHGMPYFEMVGLPDMAVRESRDRVRAVMAVSGYEYPSARITVNLAPADVRKEGALYDVPLFLAMLAASEQIAPLPEDAAFIGELSLDGRIRPVNGVLPMALSALANGIKTIFVPRENAAEAVEAKGVTCYAPSNVAELLDHLSGRALLPEASTLPAAESAQAGFVTDLSDVRGQNEARRALEIAAAGGHNILLIGPPGSGKSMLAKRLPGILPDMTYAESVETTMIHSVAGLLPAGGGLVTTRPFRSPHHNASPAALAGGGSIPGPGEVSLAHNGVLFLDELPEFAAQTMEIMRQPLEDGMITISRATGRVTYPCRFQLVAAMNPCRCGYFGHPTRECTCSPVARQRYLAKISGPLLDRMDIQVEVPPVDYERLSDGRPSESSASVRKRVAAARERQRERFGDSGITCNAAITPALIHEACAMTDRADTMLNLAFERLGLSGRGYDRLLKLARTIADLDGSDIIDAPHIAEAVQYRSLDRKYWRT